MLGINLSPLQYLAANGIAFAAGIAAVLILRMYGEHMYASGLKEAKTSPR